MNVVAAATRFTKRAAPSAARATTPGCLPHSKVSGTHAVISYRDAASSTSRTEAETASASTRRRTVSSAAGRTCAEVRRSDSDRSRTRSGSRSRATKHDRAGAGPAVRSRRGRASPMDFDAANPFDADDPFAPRPIDAVGAGARPTRQSRAQELDPLELLNLGSNRARSRNARRPRPGISIGHPCWRSHYQPPAVVPDPPLAIAGEQHVDSGGLRPACRRRCCRSRRRHRRGSIRRRPTGRSIRRGLPAADPPGYQPLDPPPAYQRGSASGLPAGRRGASAAAGASRRGIAAGRNRSART